MDVKLKKLMIKNKREGEKKGKNEAQEGFVKKRLKKN